MLASYHNFFKITFRDCDEVYKKDSGICWSPFYFSSIHFLYLTASTAWENNGNMPGISGLYSQL
ncbi:hypothetical protein SAMN05443144_10324 [Fodinibius roseus]|uniref:Uncharacterized protein n=1 Tax=Fodinibius roseus TaxID=1194090 RepID=A0A1M4VRY7_9BACT|nr:hypothetical protein SAMN05443144_10324 [Fodinibius roseus]